MAATRKVASERRRLLIVACSARKIAAARPIRAWELYDGVAYRLVKRLQRDGNFPADVDTLVLSAKHGLISPSARITAYDQRMNSVIATAQAMRNARILRRYLQGGRYGSIYLFMGRSYRQALLPFTAWCGELVIEGCAGRIGMQLRRLKLWLLAER